MVFQGSDGATFWYESSNEFSKLAVNTLEEVLATGPGDATILRS